MKIFMNEGQRAPIKSWCENPEQEAIEQAVAIASLPFIRKHVALMPDTHAGFDMPIGGVVCCERVVVPSFVGVDIGCGMLACKTSLNIEEVTTDKLKEVLGLIREIVPAGMQSHEHAQSMPYFDWDACKIAKEQRQRASYQLGTLGGGNHFIEIQRDEDGCIWFMIHSGSRNLGFTVANHYVELAKKTAELWHSVSSVGFLPEGTRVFEDYIAEMNLCLMFAQANRDRMAYMVQQAFETVFLSCSFEQPINIHHNYAAIETHYGETSWVHRKGATLAREGTIGIIPGSQGTCSYIVRGKGNKESFMSCSHGAGRKMSRTKARATLNVEDETKMLGGILHSIRSEKDLDEAPSAYKDIDVVMEEQKDLVDIVTKLYPLAVIKG